MNAVLKRVTLRVIKDRISNSETFETIIADYPKLTTDDIAELKTELGITDTATEETTA